MRTKRDGPRRKITASGGIAREDRLDAGGGGGFLRFDGHAGFVARPRNEVQPMPYGLPHSRLSTVGPPGPYSAPTQPFQPIASIASKIMG